MYCAIYFLLKSNEFEAAYTIKNKIIIKIIKLTYRINLTTNIKKLMIWMNN